MERSVEAKDTVKAKELIGRAKKSDPEAFSQLYDMYYDEIFKYSYFRIGNIVKAEDLALQVFNTALDTINSFSQRQSSFTSWLYKIAQDVVVDHWREGDKEHFEPDDKQSTLEHKMLYLALDRLADDQAEIVTLRFINGLSEHETASVMGKSMSVIKSEQYRAIKRLNELRHSDASG